MRRLMIAMAIGDVALLVYLLVAISQRRISQSAPSPSPQIEQTASPSEGAAPKTLGEDRTRNSPKRLDWRLLALADLHKFVANLREIGCPELTIQDIIIAEV